MRRKTRHAHLWLRCLRRHGPETASTPPLGLEHHPALESAARCLSSSVRSSGCCPRAVVSRAGRAIGYSSPRISGTGPAEAQPGRLPPRFPGCHGAPVSGPWRAGRPCPAADAVRRQPLAVEGEDQGATCHGRAVTGTMSGPRLHRRGAAGDGMTLRCTRATRGNAHDRARSRTASTADHAARSMGPTPVNAETRSANGDSPSHTTTTPFRRSISRTALRAWALDPCGRGTAGRPAEQRSLFALQF
jgi:hypothetical protein